MRIFICLLVTAPLLWGCGNSGASRLAGQGNPYARADYLLNKAERMPGADATARAASAYKRIRGDSYRGGEYLEYGYDEEAASIRGNPQVIDSSPRYHGPYYRGCWSCWR